MRKLIYFSLCSLLVAGALMVVAQSQTPEIGAPVVDRIGFPEGCQSRYKLMYVFDHFQNRQVRIVYGNDVAASVQPGQPFPYGSILVGEFYPARRDAQGEPVLDENGRFIPDGAPTINVMRKEVGFGTAYKSIRNGEWEYVAYRADGSYATRPENTASCANCHLQAGNQRDFVFRANLYLHGGSGALPDGVMKNFRYVPGNFRIRAGQTLTWYNVDDSDFHTVVADNGSFQSGQIDSGASFSVRFPQAGRYDFHCDRHPRMRGTIIVDP